MSDRKIIIDDELVEARLEENSNKLNISLHDLIDRYVGMGLYCDDYYEPPKLTREELLEASKRRVEKDKEMGIFPKKHNFDIFVGRWDD
jgi:hypothetical protein